MSMQLSQPHPEWLNAVFNAIELLRANGGGSVVIHLRAIPHSTTASL